MTTTTDTRAETNTARARLIADARALLDLIEANPDLPFAGLEILEHANGTDAEGRGQVNDAAAVLGIEPAVSRFGNHYYVIKTIGRASYKVLAIPAATMERHRAVQTLGKAAVDALGTGAAS